MARTVQYAGADLYPKQRAAIYDPARIAIVEASTKAGKGQPLDATVICPSGPRRMGELAVGDHVLTPDGGSSAIRAIYPLGERDIYRVTFSDGSSTECTLDHLWEVQQDRGKTRSWVRVLTLETLMAMSRLQLRRTWIPTTEPVNYASQSVPVPPYLLGALLGDGSLLHESIVFSSTDAEILERVTREAGPDYSLRASDSRGCNFVLTLGPNAKRVPEERRLIPKLKALGVWGKASHEKFVPEAYLRADVTTRWEIIRGLFDTDGSVNKKGQPMLEQTSAQLAADVADLVAGLGGHVHVGTKRGSYRNAVGDRVEGKTVYRLAIVHPDAPSFFTLERKRSRATPKKKRTCRKFRSIELVRRAEAQCIELAHPRGLYLTDHHIVTHNTVGCLAWLAEKALLEGRQGRNYWWCAPVFGQADIAFRRMKQKLPKAYFKANQSKLTITLVNGAVIWFKSAERFDDLYGEDVYAVVMDEASRMREESWHAIRSTLTYTRGPVRMIGNVKGKKNFFWDLARAAEAGAPDMSYHRITAWDAVEAGVLDREEIEASYRDFKRLGREGAWAQLYLAEAAADGDNPFGLEAIERCTLDGDRATREGGDSHWDHPDRLFAKAAGVDLAGRGASNANGSGPDEARDRDYTAVVMLDRDGTVCHLARFRKGHIETEERVRRTLGRTMALVDSTGTGDAVVERLQRRGDMRVEGFTFTDLSRQNLLEGLASAIGEETVRFPDGWLRDELDTFEYSYERRGVRYVVPPGMHDDGAIALALAVRKLPWRRRVTGAPVGVAKPGGSTWLGHGEDDGRGILGGQENQAASTDQDAAVVAPAPLVIAGPGANRWSGAG